MTARNKRRSYEAETAIVRIALDYGFTNAHRTWGSDGRAEGLDSKVDIVAGDEYIQSKRMKSPPKYLGEMVDLMRKGIVNAVSFYFDRKGSWILLPAERYFELRRHEATLRASSTHRHTTSHE